MGVPKASFQERLEGNIEPAMNIARQFRINYYIAKWLLRNLPGNIPQELHTHLSQQLFINKIRNTLLTDQITRLAEMFQLKSIPVMFLKGAAGLAYGMYDPECRFLSDIDILIPNDRIPEAQSLIESEGYNPEKNMDIPRNHHHIIPYYHKKNVGGLEIHREPYGMSMLDRPAMPDIWHDAVTTQSGDALILVPSLTDHAWIAMRSEALTSVYIPRIKETIELAEVMRFGHVDFDSIRSRAERENMPGLAVGYACSLSRLFNIYLPVECETHTMRSWLRWSRRQQARMLKHGDRLKASRTRFGAVKFLSPKGLVGKIRLNSRIIRYDIEYERTAGRLMATLIFFKNLMLHLFWLFDCAWICRKKDK